MKRSSAAPAFQHPHIDLPKAALPAVGAADFGQKLIDFMAATPGPAPT